MRLHYNAFSSNSRRAMVVAFHLGTKLDLVRVDLAAHDQRKPEFLRMNPNGKVPVLEDGDFFVWESNAIAEYLCELTSGQTLLPSSAKARADVTRWTYWTSAHLAPSVGILGFENFVKKIVYGGDPDPKEVSRGEKLVSDLVAVVDRHLEGRDWLAQDRLTLADLAVASTVFARERIKLPAMPPRVNAWLARVESLPAWKQCERTP